MTAATLTQRGLATWRSSRPGDLGELQFRLQLRIVQTASRTYAHTV
jgi:hypothetical protein